MAGTEIRDRVLEVLRDEQEAAGEPDGWAEEITEKIFDWDESAPPKLPRLLLKVDPTVPAGDVRVGGSIILKNPSDEELGWAIGAKIVCAADEQTLGHFLGRACEALGACELKWIDK